MEKVWLMISSVDCEMTFLGIHLFFDMDLSERRIFIDKYFITGDTIFGRKKGIYYMCQTEDKSIRRDTRKVVFYKDGYMMYIFDNGILYYHKDDVRRHIEVNDEWEKIYL